MGPYLVTLALICGLGGIIEYGRSKQLTAMLLVGKKPITVQRLDFLWLFIFLILTLFGGLRYRVGTDYDSYCTMFAALYEDWNEILYGGTERGYVWLNRIVTLYTNDPQWIIFISNAIVSWIGVHCLRKYGKFAPFGLFIFFTTLYYYSFNVIRQGMAASFIFWAVCEAREKKWISTVLLCFVAFLFHKTSLIMVPVLLLMCHPYKTSRYFVFFAGATLCMLFKIPISEFLISTFYPNTAGDAATAMSDFSPTQVILCLMYMGLCVLYAKQMLQCNKGNILYVNLSVLIFSLYTFFFWIPMWSRLNLYFIGLYALIVPEAVVCEKDKKMRLIYYSVLLGILLFFYIGPSLIGQDGYAYQAIWERPPEYLSQLYLPK